MNIPIFPLPIFLLPEGITRLRIFEQRYLNMVKIASTENGFAILMNDKSYEKNNSPIASWVNIIDFDNKTDGILQIDVKCNTLISLENMRVDQQNLMWAEGKTVTCWPMQTYNDKTLILRKLLLSIFKEDNELSELYRQNYIDTPNWIISRWLELIPIKNKDKKHFYLSNSFFDAVDFLSELLLNHKNINESDLI